MMTANMYARPAKMPANHAENTILIPGTYSRALLVGERLTYASRALDWRRDGGWVRVTGLPDQRGSRRRHPMRP
jgi:hypothetical protein